MTKHYGLFYTEPTESAITTLHFERIGELKELQKLAEIFVEQLQNINKDDLKFVWNDLTYCANDADYAYVILEVLDIDDKTIKTTYEENDRYYSNRDTGYWSEIMTITKQQKYLIEQKPKRTVWVALQPCDDPYYPDNIIFIEESKEKIKEVCEKHFNKSSNDWYDRIVFENEQEKIVSHELKGTDVEIEEIEMGVKI